MTHHTSDRFMSVYPAMLLSYAWQPGQCSSLYTPQMLMRGVSSEQSQCTEPMGKNGAGLALLWAMTTSEN